MAPKRTAKKQSCILESILLKNTKKEVKEEAVISMQTNSVVRGPLIISDSVDFEIENQCLD